MHAQPPCKQPVSHGFTVPKSVPVPSLCTRKGVPLPVPSSRHRLCLPSQAPAERSWPSGKGISQVLWGLQPPWRHLGSALGAGTVTARVPGTVGPWHRGSLVPLLALPPTPTTSLWDKLPWEHPGPVLGHLVTPHHLWALQMLASLTQSPRTPAVISRCVQAAAPSKPSQLYPTAGSSPSAFPQRQTWVFKSKELMVKASSAVPEGSLVYVREGSNAFLRTPTGWSRLLVPCGVPLGLGGAGCRAGIGTGRADPQEGEHYPILSFYWCC